MSSYVRYCQRQAADCARRVKLASSADIKAYHRRLGLEWLKLAEKARVARARTRDATIALRDAPANTPSPCAICEEFTNPKAVAAEHLSQIRRACHNVALAAIVFVILLWW